MEEEEQEKLKKREKEENIVNIRIVAEDKFFIDCFTIRKELTEQRIHFFRFRFFTMVTME
jgi:hypothetical protein